MLQSLEEIPPHLRWGMMRHPLHACDLLRTVLKGSDATMCICKRLRFIAQQRDRGLWKSLARLFVETVA